MFVIEQPAMALNDTRGTTTVNMQINRTIQPEEGVTDILQKVVVAAKGTTDGKLKSLVLECHGQPGQLIMGAGIDRSLVDRFSMLVVNKKPLVETIYLRSCLVARIDGPGSMSDGNLFCSAIAKNAKCTVVASTAIQSQRSYKKSQGESLPYGMLDEFEGTVLFYGPEGNVWHSFTNPAMSFWSSNE
ncbi:MAG: hypothetical protein ABI999_19060 [Acidobacteriota bacterium]